MRAIEPGAGVPGRSLLKAKDHKALSVVFLMVRHHVLLTCGIKMYFSDLPLLCKLTTGLLIRGILMVQGGSKGYRTR